MSASEKLLTLIVGVGSIPSVVNPIDDAAEGVELRGAKPCGPPSRVALLPRKVTLEHVWFIRAPHLKPKHGMMITR